jgi:hypothetical protein
LSAALVLSADGRSRRGTAAARRIGLIRERSVSHPCERALNNYNFRAFNAAIPREKKRFSVPSMSFPTWHIACRLLHSRDWKISRLAGPRDMEVSHATPDRFDQ